MSDSSFDLYFKACKEYGDDSSFDLYFKACKEFGDGQFGNILINPITKQHVKIWRHCVGWHAFFHEDDFDYHPIHHSVAVAGMFDHLHDGHKAVIRKAVECTEKILYIRLFPKECGVGRKFYELIQPWDERKKAIEDYVAKIKGSIICKFKADITSYLEPEVSLFVCGDDYTHEDVCESLEHRMKIGLCPAEALLVKCVMTKDGKKKISSSDLRKQIELKSRPKIIIGRLII